MLLPVPPPSRRRPRPRVKLPSAAAPVPPVAGPVLSSAYVEEVLFLFFDGYDINVDAFDPGAGAITLNDPASGSMYAAASAEVVGGSIVQIALTLIGPSSGTQTILNASADSGIVDADSGLPWAGASALPLPFP